MRSGEHGHAKLKLVLGAVGIASMPWLLSCHRDSPPPEAAVAAVPVPVAPAPSPPPPVTASEAAESRPVPAEPARPAAPEVAAPAAPAELVARLVSPTEAELRWKAAAGIDRYQVLRGEKVVATVEGTTARVPGVVAGRRACFGVRALDTAGNPSLRSPEACVVGADVTPPSAPGALSAKAAEGRVELSWAAAQDDVGVARYEVLRDGAPLATATPTATTAVDAGARAARTYCYTVRAYDAATNASPPAGPACVTVPDTTPPTVPAEVAARPQGTNGVAVRWAPSTDDVGVARYEVLRGGEPAARTEKLEATFWPLRAAVEHCFAVRACDAAGNCSAPSAAACVTLPDVEPPSRVALVTVTPGPDEGLTVHWTSALDDVGVVEYELRDGDRVVSAGRERSVFDRDLPPGTRHCYTVVARDAAGNASRPSEPACATTPDSTPPTPPQDVVAAVRSSRQAYLSWGAATDDVGVAGYEVLKDGVVVARTSQLSAWFDDLLPDQEYCASVRALDAAGNRSASSAPVCVRTPKPEAPAAPWNLTARPAPKRLELSWDPSPDPDVVYVVFRDKGTADAAIGMTCALKFQVVGSEAEQRRCYRVAAMDAARRSSPKTLPVCASAKLVGEEAGPAGTRVAGAAMP
ncbi:MAG TPA: fibronectin type III domain-containing protein [Anaeromyxobacter sp.]